MGRTVESIVCNSMVRFCILYALAFVTLTADGLNNKYCNMNCVYDENLTFTHTVCERGKEVDGFNES